MHGTNDPQRRLHPRIFDTDWLLMRGLARFVRERIRDVVEPGASVLDFGCGSMPYRGLVEERGGIYTGADFDPMAQVVIRSDGRLQCPDDSVDVVLSFQVLEHVRDLDLYFAEIRRVLKPQGKVLLSTHGTWLYHPHPEDHRRWTRTGLIYDIERSGLTVKTVDAIVGPLGTTLIIRSTGMAMLLRRIPFFGRIAAGAAATVMNIRALLEDAITPAQIKTDNACVYLTVCERV